MYVCTLGVVSLRVCDVLTNLKFNPTNDEHLYQSYTVVVLERRLRHIYMLY